MDNRPDVLERTRPVKTATKAADTREGIVEAFPSVTGNLDQQRDVIIPGAIRKGFDIVAKPKMLFDHDWSKITGKALEAREVMPNDTDLPADLQEQGFGGLKVVNQLNLEKELARDVLSDIVFFDDDGEWSIGYETLDAEFMETEDGDPFRGLKAIVVWEDSFVLFGANRLTRTVGAKGVDGAAVKSRLEQLDAAGRDVVLDTLSRHLGVNVTPGKYAVAGGKTFATSEQDGDTVTAGATAVPSADKEAIGTHSTDTSDGEWDASDARSSYEADADELRRYHAWVDPDGDADAKSSYKFPHHFPESGAASTRACTAGIAVLNGARGGADVPDDDVEGIYRHLASHLDDADVEPPELDTDDADDPDGKFAEVPGSIEERLAQIRDAVQRWAASEFGDDAHAWPVATMDDEVIVQVDTPQGEAAFRIGYAMVEGGVALGDVEEVELVVDVQPAGGGGEARRQVARALMEDHGAMLDVLALLDASDPKALPAGVVMYELSGDRLMREWALDGYGGVALSDIADGSGVLSDHARKTIGQFDVDECDGPPARDTDSAVVLDEADLMRQEMARVKAR